MQEIAAEYNGLQLIFLYMGSETGLESRLARAAGLDYQAIATGKLRRSRRLLGLLSRANVMDAFRVPLGFVQALRLVRRFRPDVVFSTGGYVGVPPVLAAGVLKRPVLIHEQTVQIGLANRLCARIARRIALSFEDSRAELPPREQAKCFLTGNVVRPVIFGGDPARAAALCGFDPSDGELLTVYVTGGAQGSRLINDAVGAALGELLTFCRVIHQCGRQAGDGEQDETRLKALANELPENLRRRYFVTPFVGDEIGDVYALADVIVGRSGAGTVSEVCALGKPALFIPLVPTGGDEQTKNARRLQSIGAAGIIPQGELTAERLTGELRSLATDRDGLLSMGAAAKTLATPNAARDLAKVVIELGLG